MDYALQLLIPILLGLYAGQWLDAKTGKAPWFTLVGMILGMLLGFGILYKRVTYGSKPHAKNSTSADKKKDVKE